jgi:hypothetical protein
MTQQTDGDDQAFATPPVFSEAFGLAIQEKGLSKREYFAAMAMQGVCANSSITERASYKTMAELSVKQADALIEALNKKK